MCCLVDNSPAVSDIVATSPAAPLVCAALVEKLLIELLFLLYALNAVDAF